MKKIIKTINNSHPGIGIILFILFGYFNLFGGNGIVIGLHANFADWSQCELGIGANHGRQLSVSTGSTMYCTSGPENESTPGAYIIYSSGWNGGSGTKGWTIPMTTSAFNNLTLTFYQRSRIQLVTEIGPRDFKLQYSTNGSSWTDVPGANFILTNSWQQFSASLPAACNNQTILYLRWIMSSNVSLSGGAIVPNALSDFADFRLFGDEAPQPITNMNLSKTLFPSSAPSDTTVGTFTAIDANLYDIFTYSLVSGTGDTYNGSFTITGSTLKNASVLSPGSYSIRVQVSDGTYTFTEIFVIHVSAYPLVTLGDPNYNYDEWITRVQIGNIDRSSGMSGTNNSIGYSDYTDDSVNVYPGESINLTITAHVVDTYGEYIRVYFDWNHDLDLIDPGEQIVLLSDNRTPNTDLSPTVNITIPSNAAPGSTMMRVAIDNYGHLALANIFDDYGEVEDYTVNIHAVTLTDGSTFTPVISSGNSDQVLGCFRLTGSFNGMTLTSATVKLNGVRTGLSNIKLWASTDDSFGSDDQLGTTTAIDPGDGNSVSFTFSSSVPTSEKYYFLTGDIAADATGTLQGVIVQNSSLNVTGGSLSGTISNAVLSNSLTSLPVELTSFDAESAGSEIFLNWQTKTEINNYGFEIERSSEPSKREGSNSFSTGREEEAGWKKIGFVQGHGNSNSPQKYSFTDKNPSGGYSKYRLKQIDTDGKYQYYPKIADIFFGESEDLKKLEFALEQNFPNPFNPVTIIKYSVPSQLNNEASSPGPENFVSLRVYDILGKEVAVLVNEYIAPGSYKVEFNPGKYLLSNGVYFYRLNAGSNVSTKKLILLK